MSAASILLCLLLQDPPVDPVLARNPGGFCLLVEAGGPDLAARVAAAGRWVVHALDRDEARVRRLRASGVHAERWGGGALPHAEHLVSLVVAGPGSSREELLRVLVPGGTAFLAKEGGWETLVKPRPADHDEWTHWRHGADGNMVSKDRAVSVPSGLRWVSGPPQDAGGRKWYFDHILVTSNGRNFYAYDDAILARDSYNGILLWTRDLKAPSFKESGLPVPPNSPPKIKLAGRISKVRPVAAGDRLYAAGDGRLLALDGASGKTVADFGETRKPREILLSGGKLLLTEDERITAFDPGGGTKAWETEIASRRAAIDGDVVCVITPTHVVGLALATGRELWRTADEEAALALTCTSHDGYFVLEKSTLRDDPVGCGIKVYSTKTGELLWVKDYPPDMTHYRESRAYFVQGLVWIPAEKEGLLGLDPRSGSERKKWGTRGKHCATPVATQRYFLAPECEFTDLADGTQTRSRIFKSACRQPFIPANGLLYTFPVQCECFPMLRGTMGLSSGPAPALLAAGRLETGTPAAASEALLKPASGDEEWPMYRRDAWRTGSTPMKLRRAEPSKAWEVELSPEPKGALAGEWEANPYTRGVLTAPVAAGGLVIVAASDQRRVIAVDAETGKLRWAYDAGGRIDGPPSVTEGLCLFGSHDGRVTALRLGDGAVAWSLRAAPAESRIVAYGQVESPWPVVGSVLVDGGLAFAAAGRHPTADGGVRVLAIRPRTGEVVWEKVIDNLDAITRWYGGTLQGSKVKVGVDFEPVDLLVRDGDRVAMSRWCFAPADGTMTLELNSTTYGGPGGLAVPRGFWGYGIRQTKMVVPRPPAVIEAGALKAGVAGDAAMIAAGGTIVTVTKKGDLRVGSHLVELGTAPIFDGMIAAYGGVYLATGRGTLIRVE